LIRRRYRFTTLRDIVNQRGKVVGLKKKEKKDARDNG
jgi:hypothetical protein